MKFILPFLMILTVLFLSCNIVQNSDTSVEKWDIFELQFHGPESGNPFKDVTLTALFSTNERQKEVNGFYAGDGIYKIRFMPEKVGQWYYETKSNVDKFNGRKGIFNCIPPLATNHGPVEVFNTYHFKYADSTPYKQVGTTCYAWIHQGDSLEQLTLETLKNAPFNKLRMCIFPKDYSFNKNEPVYYPFERDSLGNNDFTRFNPDFWDHLDRRLQDLLELGIEADIILFHPYDRWGYATMSDDVDEFYLKYVLARLSAYRNVWWSAANEFDLMNSKSMADWHRIFEILYKCDPYNHLRSIHNCIEFYDHSLPWITHASIQSTDFEKAIEWREEYKKPLIYDECRYEGNVRFGWGNLTPEEMTAMFWKSLIKGTYAGHGETYLHPDDVLWWSKGGVLHGESPQRIAFFRTILNETPETGLTPMDRHSAGKHGEQYIYYFDEETPAKWSFDLPENIYYQVEIIDTWNMQRDTLGNRYNDSFTIDLPGKKYLAVRITKSGLMFPIKDPDYSPKGNLFYDDVEIRLLHPYPNTLRYTLDGSMPDEESKKYTEPMVISENTTLKVLSIDGDRGSKLLQVDFKKAELQQAIDVDGLESGLNYAYYTGKWEMMPDFDLIDPVKTGQVDAIDFSMIEDEDYFGVTYEGYIQIPEDDVYTFYSSSDDGSFIFIDGVKIVENDGIHGIVEKMGQIGLEKGFHKFEVCFFDNWYDHVLKVEIQSKHTERQMVSPAMLYRK